MSGLTILRPFIIISSRYNIKQSNSSRSKWVIISIIPRPSVTSFAPSARASRPTYSTTWSQSWRSTQIIWRVWWMRGQGTICSTTNRTFCHMFCSGYISNMLYVCVMLYRFSSIFLCRRSKLKVHKLEHCFRIGQIYIWRKSWPVEQK